VIHHDTPQYEADKPSFWFPLLVLLGVLMPLVAAGFTAYTPDDGQHRTDTNTVQQHANSANGADPNKGSLQQGVPPKPSESPDDTPFYNEPSPATELTTLYTNALREAVKKKDTKACQAGLENFRTELSKAPMVVLRDIDAANTQRSWQIPTYDSFLDTVHITYACQQATKLDRMSDNAPDTRAHKALAILADITSKQSNGAQKCFDILSTDYRYYVQNTSVAGKVMLSLLVRTLPQEISDKELATLCGHHLGRQV